MALHLHRKPQLYRVSIELAACGSTQWLLQALAIKVLAACLPEFQLHMPAYLIVHNSLLESRSCHSLSPWVLMPRPNRSSVRRLHNSSVLRILHTLLQSFTLVRRLNWELVGLRHVGYLLQRLWIIDLLLIVGGKGVASSRRHLDSPGKLPYGSGSHGGQHCGGFSIASGAREELSLL
jgi:hypothetical protein